MKKTLFMMLKPPEGELPSPAGRYGEGSGLLLLEDAVLRAVRKDTLEEMEKTGMTLYALRDSVAARGFLEGFPDSVKLVSPGDLPGLIMEEYETSITL
jgi:sulfur relay protein TusB/DsrH